MPAISVDNYLTLPKISLPLALGDHSNGLLKLESRKVGMVTKAPSGFEGEGFPVRRAFSGVPMRELDPFVHMDQMGEVNYLPGEPKGTPWHPHRGFETVTYIMDGIFVHQDSNGGGGIITNGDTQWMTAGSGILHIETPPEELVLSGGLFHGVQLWVNLPASLKYSDPRYQDIRANEISLLSSQSGGALIRVIAGQIGDFSGPGITHTPISLCHVTVKPDESVDIPWNKEFNCLAYVLAGKGSLGAENINVSTGNLGVMEGGDYVTLRANKSQDESLDSFEVLLLGGKPIGEAVVAYGPFVMNTKDEIRQAFEDYEKGRLGVIPPGAIGT